MQQKRRLSWALKKEQVWDDREESISEEEVAVNLLRDQWTEPGCEKEERREARSKGSVGSPVKAPEFTRGVKGCHNQDRQGGWHELQQYFLTSR